jgi:2-polyprenyl-3-methyl-5-hydroxy-6-metoxy-1,4-benzoquinol methylase
VTHVSGTEGYTQGTERFVSAAESVSFARLHAKVLHLMPQPPCAVLDVGAGTGRDAAQFAAMGHRVVAVEPVQELRAKAAELHPSQQIEWLDDSLPDLAKLAARHAHFDLIMLTAVFMHLDKAQRRHAILRLAGLMRPRGTLILSLRHGPVPPGRLMFDVSAEETAALARDAGLALTLRLDDQPSQIAGKSDVTWTLLAFAQL